MRIAVLTVVGLGDLVVPCIDGLGRVDSFDCATFVGGVSISRKNRRNGNSDVRSASVVATRTQSLQRNDFVPIRTRHFGCSS